IPFPKKDETVERVARLITTSVLNREAYAAAMRRARSIIEAPQEIKIATEMCREIRARCLAYKGKTYTTLSAWNYASTGGALEYLRREWATRVKDLVEDNGIFLGPRVSRLTCDAPYGINFYSQRDVFLM